MDENAGPQQVLRRCTGMTMDLSRSMALGSQIQASEIKRGAPITEDFLETTLTDRVASHEVMPAALAIDTSCCHCEKRLRRSNPVRAG